MQKMGPRVLKENGTRGFLLCSFVCALALAGGEPPRAKGELTFGKLAVVITFCQRAGACGFWILQIRRFFVLPDGT